MTRHSRQRDDVVSWGDATGLESSHQRSRQATRDAPRGTPHSRTTRGSRLRQGGPRSTSEVGASDTHSAWGVSDCQRSRIVASMGASGVAVAARSRGPVASNIGRASEPDRGPALPTRGVVDDAIPQEPQRPDRRPQSRGARQLRPPLAPGHASHQRSAHDLRPCRQCEPGEVGGHPR